MIDRKSSCSREQARSGSRGQSLVELALTLPLLALILLGTVDLARAFFYYQRLTNAVREGALVGTFDPTNPDNRIRVRIQSEQSGIPDSQITILCYEGLTGPKRGTT